MNGPIWDVVMWNSLNKRNGEVLKDHFTYHPCNTGNCVCYSGAIPEPHWSVEVTINTLELWDGNEWNRSANGNCSGDVTVVCILNLLQILAMFNIHNFTGMFQYFTILQFSSKIF